MIGVEWGYGDAGIEPDPPPARQQDAPAFPPGLSRDEYLAMVIASRMTEVTRRMRLFNLPCRFLGCRNVWLAGLVWHCTECGAFTAAVRTEDRKNDKTHRFFLDSQARLEIMCFVEIAQATDNLRASLMRGKLQETPACTTPNTPTKTVKVPIATAPPGATPSTRR